VIKDLTESKELDTEAMRAITGGRASPGMHITLPAPRSSFSGNPLSFSALTSTTLPGFTTDTN
jgi:hypothetical protein